MFTALQRQVAGRELQFTARRIAAVTANALLQHRPHFFFEEIEFGVVTRGGREEPKNKKNTFNNNQPLERVRFTRNLPFPKSCSRDRRYCNW